MRGTFMDVRGRPTLPGDCPLTWGLILAHAATFLAAFLGVGGRLRGALVFHGDDAVSRPWTFLTYPLIADNQILFVLLGSYVLWLFGGSLERGWRVRGYLPFLLLVTTSSSIALWAGAAALGRSISLAGLWLPLSGIVYAWTLINPRQRILVYMVLPVEARWLGVVTLVLLFFGFPFPLGAFALAGCGVAVIYIRWLRFRLLDWVRPTARRGRASDVRRERGPANPIVRFQRWQRKRKFIRLMERSGLRDRDSK